MIQGEELNHLAFETSAACQRMDEILAACKPEVIGAVLAYCVARWLAGFGAGDQEQADKRQAEVLAAWLVSVKEFLHVYK